MQSSPLMRAFRLLPAGARDLQSVCRSRHQPDVQELSMLIVKRVICGQEKKGEN